MGVKVVFHRVNFEWLVTVKLTSKFVVKVSFRKYHARTWGLKQKSCGARTIKTISSSLKILQLPHQKSNCPPLICYVGISANE